MAERILTTHVGSLVRPPELIEFLQRRENDEPYDAAALEAALDKSVADVVRHQAAIGIDIINDGEFRKPRSWMSYIVDRLDGVTPQKGGPNVGETLEGKDFRDFPEFYAEYWRGAQRNRLRDRSWAVTGKLRYRREAVERDIAAFKAALAGVEHGAAFMTAVAPASVIFGGLARHIGEEELLFSVAEALREEYRAIVDAGFILQIDDAFLATTYDVMVPPGTLEDFRRWAAIRVEALNHALAGIPEDRTRYHVCWGSWNGPHTNDLEVKHVIDLILRVRTGGYSLEMANPRHEHEWRVWETTKLPEGKTLLPGVISHATNIVEHPELVAERIVRLARLVGRDNVIASTDCGFAQSPLIQRVHPSIMWAKLGSLVEGARLASRELWGRKAA